MVFKPHNWVQLVTFNVISSTTFKHISHLLSCLFIERWWFLPLVRQMALPLIHTLFTCSKWNMVNFWLQHSYIRASYVHHIMFFWKSLHAHCTRYVIFAPEFVIFKNPSFYYGRLINGPTNCADLDWVTLFRHFKYINKVWISGVLGVKKLTCSAFWFWLLVKV